MLVDLPHSLTNGTEYLLQYFGHEYEGYPQAGDLLVKFEHQLLASHSLQLHNTFDVLYTHTIQHLSQLILSSSSFSYQPHLLAIVIANSLLSAFLDPHNPKTEMLKGCVVVNDAVLVVIADKLQCLTLNACPFIPQLGTAG